MNKLSTPIIAGSIVLGILLVLISGFVGYQLGINKPNPTDKKPQSEVQEAKVTKNPLFTTQSATIHGKITAINDKLITIQTINNITQQVKIADNVAISKLGNNNRPNPPTSDIKTLESNKNVLLSLEFMDGEYKVVSITYLPDTNTSTPPIPKLK